MMNIFKRFKLIIVIVGLVICSQSYAVCHVDPQTGLVVCVEPDPKVPPGTDLDTSGADLLELKEAVEIDEVGFEIIAPNQIIKDNEPILEKLDIDVIEENSIRSE